MTDATRVQPFRFSDRNRQALEQLFEGQARAKSFINAAQEIVGSHLSVMSDFSELPSASSMRSNARAIEKAARDLLAGVARLKHEETELVGQFMWIADKINYYPGASSVQRSVDMIRVLQQAAQKLVTRGKGGRPGLQLEGLIRELHASYVTSFKARPVMGAASDSNFAVAVKICMAEAGIARPPQWLQVLRDALGEEQNIKKRRPR